MKNKGKSYTSEPIGKLWTHIKTSHNQLGLETEPRRPQVPDRIRNQNGMNVWFPKQAENWGHAQNSTSPANKKKHRWEGEEERIQTESESIDNFPTEVSERKKKGSQKEPHNSKEASLFDSEGRFSQSKNVDIKPGKIATCIVKK